MINKLGVCWGWRLGLMGCCLVWPIVFCGLVEAQSIREDATLGAESSRVIRNVRIRGRDNIERDSDRIDGGARRGANLFHSFEQFDVLEGRGAYFSNPDGIRNILSRVTGGDRSEIFGVLGVLGDANLFFLNPNGIVFGPNSSLDIGGSFLATTADGIGLGDQGLFSATAPEQSNLLDVNPGALFFNQVNAQGGVINSAGTLAAGHDLTLAGQNLDLQGQLLAGGNLTLQAKDTLRIRDSVTNPFVAASGGQMLVQGDRVVDIFALNHPNSGLVSGGDMVLRSANQVGGDAHYWSGGNFRIEQLDGSLGDLYSPYDPIIRVVGDLELGNYFGASLHILAGGSVNIPGFVGIQGSDTTGAALTETVSLSNGTALAIDGTTRPTVDIRAGVDPNEIGTPLGLIGDGSFPITGTGSNTATSTDISVGYIGMLAPGGMVYLTNQYQPNNALPAGNISIGGQDGIQGIETFSEVGNGGSVTIDSRNNIILDGNILSRAPDRGGDITLLADRNISIGDDTRLNTSALGNAGNISIQAGDSITLFGPRTSITSNLLRNGIGQGGNIDIRARSFSMRNNAQLDASTFGNGDAGKITIDVDDAISFSDSNTIIFNNIESGAIGNTGGIEIRGRILSLDNGAQINVANVQGNGKLGDILIDIMNSVSMTGNNSNPLSRTAGTLISNRLQPGSEGTGGNIVVRTNSLSLTGSQISTSTFGTGDAGSVLIDANDRISLTNRSGIFSSVGFGGIGNGGVIQVNADSLTIDRSDIRTIVQSSDFGLPAGQGNAGNITISLQGDLKILEDKNSEIFSGISTAISSGVTEGLTERDIPTAGDIRIVARDFSISGGVQIKSTLDPGSVGEAGDVDVRVRSLTMSDTAGIETGTAGKGDAGNISVQASESVTLRSGAGITSGVSDGGLGDSGNIDLEAGTLSVTDGSQVSTGVGRLVASPDRDFSDLPNARGNAGNINISVREVARFSGTNSNLGFDTDNPSGVSSEVFSPEGGTGGNINIQAGSVLIENDAELNSRTRGIGRAGNINFDTPQLVLSNASKVIATTESQADAGDITVNSNYVSLTLNSLISTAVQLDAVGQGGNVNIQTTSLDLDQAQITASTSGRGDAGEITVRDAERVTLDRSTISTTVNQGAIGNGGNIDIDADTLNLDQSNITASTSGQGDTGRINVQASDRISLINQSQITSIVETGATGNSQEVRLQTPNLVADNSQISAATSGIGNAGTVAIQNADTVSLNNSIISSAINAGATSTQPGNVDVQAQNLNLTNNAQLTASTSGQGNAGNVTVRDANTIDLNNSTISTTVNSGAIGNGGSINLETGSLDLNNSRITSSTAGQGDTGQIAVQASENIRLDNSQITNAVETGATGNSQNITLFTPQLRLNNSEVSAATDGRGQAGSIAIQGTTANSPANTVSLDSSTISTEIRSNGIVNPQDNNSRSNIDLRTRQLDLSNNSNITASTSGQGDAGNIRVRDANTISLDDQSRITTTVNQGAIGSGGDVTLQTGRLGLDNRSRISSSTAGQGDTGAISINATDSVQLRELSKITSEVQSEATGDSQQITIRTPDLSLRGDSTISAATNGTGRAGDVRVLDADRVALSNSTISTEVGNNAVVPGGSNRDAAFDSRSRSNSNPQSNITIDTRSLSLDNNAQITARTRGQGNAGDITVDADTVNIENGSSLTTSTSSDRSAGNIVLNVQDATEISGSDSGIFANTTANGNGGSITVNTDTLNLNDQARISAQSTGRGEAGDIRINTDTLTATNSTLETAARRSSGGTIEINSNQRNSRITLNNSTITTNSGDQGGNIRLGADQILLRGDSDITTSSGGNGGNIDLTAASIIAFDDSDILANSNNARGGNITLDTPAFFGSGYVPDQATTGNLDGNGRVDINATGSTASGTIRTPDTSFIQNSLSDLPDNSIDTDQLLANSCIVRDRNQPQGQFIITGADGLPDRPGSITLPDFPTGEIRNIPNDAETNDHPWQLGDPVVEPQGVYRLPDGRLVMSRECDE